MKKGRRPRRRPRLKLSDKAGPDQCPVPGENALFPAQIAGFLAVSRPIPVYPVFLKFVPPAFGEVELTPEELEEIRKREERKDRLHQNYLKRKASGAQKRYEDKIKAAKKAEMDEKKNAIRAEDIARGVFIPVSNLPKREPQKGAITA